MTKRRSGLSDKVEREVVPNGGASIADETARAPLSLDLRVEKTKTRQKSYVMDLRIHSPASLGYLGVEGLDTAPALVRLARVKGLDVIALTDFYSAAFIDRVAAAAKDSALTVIPGVVIRCAIPGCDDVILTCLFPEQRTGAHVQSFLQTLAVPQSASGEKTYIVPREMNEVLRVVEEFEGVALPSRMDKTPYRMGVLGSLVDTYGFRAFDLAYPDTAKLFKTRWPKIKFHLFSFSNANALAQVGSRIARVKMPMPGFEGIRQIVARQGA